MVVYDDNDPNAYMYDVDNGTLMNMILSVFLPVVTQRTRSSLCLTGITPLLLSWTGSLHCKHCDLFDECCTYVLCSTPDNTLINGRGLDSNNTGNLTVITVEQGRRYVSSRSINYGCLHLLIRYRFRLINMGCDAHYNFSIDGHDSLKIIEADGVNTEALETDSIVIYAAQRYSFVVSPQISPCPVLASEGKMLEARCQPACWQLLDPRNW